ncbi:MAG: class E sortase [Armatimonadota bacterium]|nr:class E sortase [Armatimonadota bacterium]MDR7427579.1 class E sortase [Armatimonadota bacterium]MDR7465280.1 class E sortase [Armatimonadota bacterium]MDR7474663.1 class E sortase [Armatimonadota bacterium]MDR7539470.1 class E sortase [Armatimonadota bacterium]
MAGTLCIAAGVLLVLAPFGWIAYTAVAVGPAQTAALAAWESAQSERAVTTGEPAQGGRPAADGTASQGMVLTIPRLELRRYVPEGATPEHLRRFGVGRITWTPLPDRPGVLGIAGHRTTYGAPFFRLDTLRRGDVILVEYGGRRYRYAVVESQVVRPERVEVLSAPLGERGIALVTCTPAYSAAFRLVVLGVLRGVTPAAAP